jgi:hypothetical protein
MSTLRIKGFVYAELDRHGCYGEAGGYKTTVLAYRSKDTDVWGVCVGEIDVPYTLPEGFDLAAETVRQKIAELEAAKDKAAREFAETTARINRQLAELQAITMSEVPA